MATYHGGTWDKNRRFHKHKLQQPNYPPLNGRGLTSASSGSTLDSGYSRAASSRKATPLEIQNMSLEKEIPRQRKVSCSIWIAFVNQVICSVSVFIIFVSPGWGRTREDGSNDPHLQGDLFGIYGLWLTCFFPVLDQQRRTCVATAILSDMPSWWISIQVMGCTFLVLTFACLLLISFYVFRIKSNRKWTLSLTHAVVSILNCLVMASCIILFAINFTDHSWWCCPNGHRITESILYWAWYLAIVALISQLISLSMSIAETCKLRT